MSRHGRGTRGVVALVSFLVLLLTLMAPASAQESTPSNDSPDNADVVDNGASAAHKIEEDLEKVFETEDEAEFLVMFEGEADTDAASGMSDWEERGRFVYETLTRHAEETQADVISDLDAMDVEYQSFWIVNTVVVTGTEETASALARHTEVESLVLSVPLEIPEPERMSPENEVLATEWGLDAINIPQVWDQYEARGEGIVVGVIDSGVQWDHPALIDHYRGSLPDGTVDHEYNWYDPTRICGDPSPEPCAVFGHGTHVTGTVVGDDGGENQIGVAPGAKHINAVGCDIPPNECSTEALLGAGQWMAAPTDTSGNNPNPDMRPHIVNNSWGGPGGEDWYMDLVDNWIDFGMFPQFASGNPGPTCGQAGSPGDYAQSYSTGGFDINGNVYINSGRGPSAIDGGIKPNISAPGVNVRSSVPGDSYASFTGTSMASPHVAGTVAVLWGAAPALVGNIEGTKAILNQTAVDTENLACGGEPDNNNVWGEGKLDALAAMEAAPLGDSGTVEGTVTDTEGAPIAGATVDFVGPTERSVTTADDGTYSVLLTVGDYQVTARAYGYLPEPADVTVNVDTTTNQDFSLELAPAATMTGTVTDDGGHGWPLYARIDIPEHPDSPFFTDPVTGEYSIELLEGTEYTMEVSAVVPGYVPATRPVFLPDDDTVQDFALDVDFRACTAPGYVPDLDGLYETFDAEGIPEGWEVVDNIGNGQTWAFNNPFGRENLTGGEGNFAIVDSAHYGRDGAQDTEFISPPVDYTQFENPSIEFKTDYRDEPYDPEVAAVDLSLDNGATWETVWQAEDDVSFRGEVSVDIPQAADATEARVRFHYYDATFAFWWQVDDVLLGELLCLPEEAGLVVGNVTDLDTGDPIVGATVAVDDNPEDTAQTVATPEDPALDDGFYILTVHGSGDTAITASRNQYAPTTETVAVVADGVVTQDFQLVSGMLSVTPESLPTTIEIGETASQELEITNNGSGAANFSISDTIGRFEPAGESADNPAPAELEPVDEAAATPPVTDRPDDAESGVSASLVGVEQTGDEPVVQDIGDWDPRAELSGGTVRFARVQCPGEFGGFYKIAGVDTAAALSDQTAWYDAATDTWTVLAPMPGGGREAPTAACTEDGRIHVIGGTSVGPTDTHFVYDIATDTWEQAAPAPRILWAAASAVWGGKLYLVGGSNFPPVAGLGNTAEVNVYDIATDTWEDNAEPLPAPNNLMGYAQAGQYLYVVGGAGDNAPTNNETATLRFDMDTGVWESGPEFSSARADLGLAVTESTLYAIGGDANGGGAFDSTDVVEQLDLWIWPDGEWVEASTLPLDLAALGAVCAADDTGPAIHAVGGAAPGPSITSMHSATPTDESCGGDATWLTQAPAEGTLEPGESTTVTVTYDASVPEVDQPGVYNANIVVSDDTPYSVPAIPVEMTANIPTPVIDEAPSVVERGEIVTLVGRNFVEPLEVNFGDTTITDANVISETELTFPVPNNARFGDHVVSVTTPEGTSNEVTMTVVRPGGPSGPVITDHPDEAMHGETVTLEGDGFRGNVRVNFGDMTIRDVDEVSETELTFVVPDNAPLGSTPTSVRAQGRTSNTVSIEVIETPDSGPPSTEPPSTEPPSTEPPSTEPGVSFGDAPDDHLFFSDIAWLAGEGITVGCNPPENTMFCPEDSVSRGEMAAFLTRALHLAETDVDHFLDDEESVFEDDINRLAQAGITRGCNPPDNDLFCVDDAVSRQEMASFLVRGYGFTNDESGDDRFTDDDFSVHEDDIEALAASGVTLGCNPPTNTQFCPLDDVIRGQMAAFLHRAATIDGSPTSR